MTRIAALVWIMLAVTLAGVALSYFVARRISSASAG